MEKGKEVLLVSAVMFGLATLFFFGTGMDFTIPVGASDFPAVFVTGALSILSFVVLGLMS